MSGPTSTARRFTARTFTVRLLAGAVLLIVAAACGSNPAAPGPGTTPTNATTPGGVLGVATTSLGLVLVDHSGRTVYLLTADTSGHSSCSTQCLQLWPLVPAPEGTSVPSVRGITAALSTAKASSGAPMLTAAGWPLYTFVKDHAPGDVLGQGVKSFGGTWYAVSSSGSAVTAPATSAPTTSSVKGGYGY